MQLERVGITAGYENFVGCGKVKEGQKEFKNQTAYNAYVNFCHNPKLKLRSAVLISFSYSSVNLSFLRLLGHRIIESFWDQRPPDFCPAYLWTLAFFTWSGRIQPCSAKNSERYATA
jgi:hypothetical protein